MKDWTNYQIKTCGDEVCSLLIEFLDNHKICIICEGNEEYEDIKRKINVFHGVAGANEVVMFGNPCTMQIISKHWTDENLKSPAKPLAWNVTA